MTDDLGLPGKWRVSAHGKTLVLTKRSVERSLHVITKALLWALYLPRYPDLKVEVSIGTRYKPDLVALDDSGKPEFWGESGEVGKRKIETLCHRYRSTHLVFAKWGPVHHQKAAMFAEIARETKRSAPVELLFFPEDSRELFVAEDGKITVSRQEIPGFLWD